MDEVWAARRKSCQLGSDGESSRPSQRGKREGTHAEKDRRAVLAVAGLVLKDLHDAQAGVEANAIEGAR
jgi:hypothetical protein